MKFRVFTLIALMMEAVCTFETPVNINVTTWRCIPEDFMPVLALPEFCRTLKTQQSFWQRASISP
jgi:hypothetical protein